MAVELSAGRTDGWPAITQVLETLLVQALASDTRRIVLLDPDFTRWPLSSLAVLEALQAWGRRGGRRLELAAPDWAACARRHARLVAWRKGFDHLLDIREFDVQDVGPEWPTALFAAQGGVVLRVLELEDGLARWSGDANDRQAAFECFDAITQRSSPGWPLTTIGL